jgi:hypothetical protein
MPTPEELEAAKAKEKADAEAKAKADAEAAAKKKLEEEGGGGPTDPKDDLEGKWDDDTKKYVKSLRDEAAKNRTDKKQFRKELDDLKAGLSKALGIDNGVPPEKQIENLKAQTEAQKFRTAILEVALDNDIRKDQVDYFSYLVEKETSKLEEGDELAEEQIQEIVAKVKKAGTTSANGNGGNTSVDDKNKRPNPDGGKGYDGMTVEQFARLSITEKSLMYEKNPDKYSAFWKEAQEKRLI